MALTVIVIIVAVGIGAALGYSQYTKNKQRLNDGRMIKRKSAYWERRFVYAMSGADFDTLLPAMQKAANTSGSAISEIRWNKANRRFQFLGVYNAAMEQKEDAGGKKIWEFSYTQFKTSNGVPSCTSEMNILLTAVEKELLAIDPATTVIDLHHSLKSHTNFF